MPSNSIRFPTLDRLLHRANPEHFWKKLLLEAESYPEILDNFPSILLNVQERILSRIDSASPSRWGRKKRDFVGQEDQYRQLDLRLEFLIVATLLTLNLSVEFETSGSESSPDVEVTGFRDNEPVFIELTARTERDPRVLPELEGLFRNQFATGGLTETLDSYSDIIKRIIEKKSDQARRNYWSPNCMLMIDISRYGISWIRPTQYWASTLESLDLDWSRIPFISISILLSELTTTELNIGTVKNLNNSNLINEKVDLISELLSSKIHIH